MNIILGVICKKRNDFKLVNGKEDEHNENNIVYELKKPSANSLQSLKKNNPRYTTIEG